MPNYKYSTDTIEHLEEDTKSTSEIVKVPLEANECVTKKAFMSKGKITANTPNEFLMCICSLPESVEKCSLVDSSNPGGLLILMAKGESSADIAEISNVHKTDRTAACDKYVGVFHTAM